MLNLFVNSLSFLSQFNIRLNKYKSKPIKQIKPSLQCLIGA